MYGAMRRRHFSTSRRVSFDQILGPSNTAGPNYEDSIFRTYLHRAIELSLITFVISVPRQSDSWKMYVVMNECCEKHIKGFKLKIDNAFFSGLFKILDVNTR